eukprot:TRINITY_DN33183_c0_g1_i1.p1 TRINITY_DN33183_c0_g1~~TRINITY_DN33183_c0_g1_i1.p1  ORF type:complete len:427 (-),score=91.88 TRINITY_DN33183_c0_g1_i1:42-1322(-)
MAGATLEAQVEVVSDVDSDFTKVSDPEIHTSQYEGARHSGQHHHAGQSGQHGAPEAGRSGPVGADGADSTQGYHRSWWLGAFCIVLVGALVAQAMMFQRSMDHSIQIVRMEQNMKIELAKLQLEADTKRTHSEQELEKMKAQENAKVEMEKAKLAEETKRLEQEKQDKAAEDERMRAEEKLRQEQHLAKLAEPGKRLKQENVALIAVDDADTKVLDKINPGKLTVYSQSAIFESSREAVETQFVKILNRLPEQVSKKISENLRSLAAGTSFQRREVVIGYKEEKTARMATRKVKGGLSQKADCGEKTLSGSRCIFPFNYDGMRFKRCTNYGSLGSSSRIWCATAVDSLENKQAWDYCHSPPAKYFLDCDDTSEKYGATFEDHDEEYVAGYDTKQIPILDSRALPEGVSQEQVMNALVKKAAHQLTF